MEYPISDLLDCLEEVDLDLRAQAGPSQQRIKELTMKKLHQQNKTRRHLSTLSKVLIAAATISALTVTASASQTFRSWLTGHFQQESPKPLSQEQVDFVEEHVQELDQSQTSDGYTMALKSVLTDGSNAYITLGITAPEEVCLDRTDQEGYASDAPVLWTDQDITIDGENIGYSATWEMCDDGDGLRNTHNMVILLSAEEGTFTNGRTCRLRFEGLTAEYTNDAYAGELTEKYGHLPKLGEMTDEEAGLLYPMQTLCQGSWEFSVTFEKANVPVAELLNAPMTCTTRGFDGSTSAVELKQLRLSPIGTVCVFEAEEGAVEPGGDIVMKDGTTVNLMGDCVGGSTKGTAYGMFRIPIALEQVDHILLTDGQTIPMPPLSGE